MCQTRRRSAVLIEPVYQSVRCQSRVLVLCSAPVPSGRIPAIESAGGLDGVREAGRLQACGPKKCACSTTGSPRESQWCSEA